MPTILIIDDNKEIRTKYKQALKSRGHDVIEAPDAVEVANILMRSKSSLDLIVLDIQIPEVDGRDIYDIVHEYAPNIPIMIASVIPLQDQKLRIPKARDYFNKADKEKVLLEKVESIVGRSSGV